MFNPAASSLRLRPLVLALMASALVACGGGGGGGGAAPAADSADKFVGTWTENCQSSTTSSSREILTLTKTGATTLSFSNTNATFVANTTCAGTATNTQTDTGTVTINGQKLIGASTVDRVDIVVAANAGNPAINQKQVFLASGTTLRPGSLSSPLDADGYPTQLADAFTKP
jgi:hypothetical protein